MRGSLPGALAVAVAALAASATTRAESPQERKRDDILQDLGLKKRPPAPPPEEPETAPPAGEPAPGTEQPVEPGAKAKGGARPTGPAAPSFARTVYPALLTTCKACHAPAGPAAASHLLFSGDPTADHRALGRFVNVRDPEASQLLAKVSGATIHGGGPLWPATSPQYQKVLAWIRGGARLDAAAAAALPAEPVSAAKPPSVKRPPEAPPVPVAAPASAPPAPAAPAPPAEVTSQAPERPFAVTVHPILMTACAVCHRPGGPAAMTRLLLSGDAARDEAAARALVDPQAPERSLLVTKAAGQMHGGGAPVPPGDPRQATLLAWVQGLAPPPAAAPPGAANSGVAVVVAPPPVAAPPPPAGAPGPIGVPPGAGFALPLGFMLNGRFDLNYERRQFTGDPFASGSAAALRSYHHFLFLSRDGADPCGLGVEVLTLLFWEGHCRLPWRPGTVSMSVSAGKIVVPFGADPLFHQSYGGLAGFDQVVLPPVWSIEGVAAHAVFWRGALALTDDLYVVRGYALGSAGAVVNLQSGFSPDDNVKLGLGNRIGAAWMGISAWYSAYFNPLGYGRHLFMQAIDVNVWRQRSIPVIGHFSLAFGLLRADVSGGGPGVGGVGYDYYDFADYLQLRYYPVDWLFLQYRAGLHTFDNRRALVLDNSRLTSADGSTHNFGIVARTRSLWFGLFYFVNLEKVDELPNDLLRFNVTYEF